MKHFPLPGRKARAPLAFVATLIVVAAAIAGQATGARNATTLVVQDGEGGNTARIAALKQLDKLFRRRIRASRSSTSRSRTPTW